MIPEFLDQPSVLGIGEIGLNKNTQNEATVFLRAPRPGREDRRADPGPHAAPGRQVPGDADDPRHARATTAGSTAAACWIDHVEEHTIRAVLDAGLWAGMTLYPITKCTPAAGRRHDRDVRPRAADGELGRRLGPSEPTAVPEFIFEMRRRGHPESADPQGRLREPAGVLQPEPEFLVSAAGNFGIKTASGSAGAGFIVSTEPHRDQRSSMIRRLIPGNRLGRQRIQRSQQRVK